MSIQTGWMTGLMTVGAATCGNPEGSGDGHGIPEYACETTKLIDSKRPSGGAPHRFATTGN